MKKIIFIIIATFLISSIGYCDKPISPALEWWLKSQDKLEGSSVCTKGNVLTKWEVDGVDQPDNDEIASIVSQYDASLVISVSDKATKEDELKLKLKIDDNDIATLKEMLK